MKPLKALISKSTIQRAHSGNLDNNIYLIWFGDYQFIEFFQTYWKSMIPGTLKDDTNFVLIRYKNLKSLKIPESLRKHMIILKTPYTDILEAHNDIICNVKKIDDLITNKDYKLIDN